MSVTIHQHKRITRYGITIKRLLSSGMPSSLHRPQYDLFRQLLVEAREQAGLTQSKVARQLGKPQSYVSKYERGERRLDFTEFLELAEVLAIEPLAFIERYRSRR